MDFLRKVFRRSAPVASDSETKPAIEADPTHEDGLDQSVEDGFDELQDTPLVAEEALEPQFDDEVDEVDDFGGTAQLATHQLQSEALPIASVSSDRPLAFWAPRDIGRVRRSNQDSIHAALLSLPSHDHDRSVGLFVVADGMGGHSGGEIASRRAIETVMVTMLEYLALPAMADEDPGVAPPLLMVTAIQEANQRIWNEAQQNGTDMGTTCTAALLLDDQIYLGHVGDSRAYIVQAGGLHQLTTDHSTVGRLIAMGQIEPEEARDHPLRNQLYRTVGQHPTLEVDIVQMPLHGASHLLLCSDGLWGMIDDEEIMAIVRESPYPRDACQRLIARANLAGGDDNISVIVVAFPTEWSA